MRGYWSLLDVTNAPFLRGLLVPNDFWISFVLAILCMSLLYWLQLQFPLLWPVHESICDYLKGRFFTFYQYP